MKKKIALMFLPIFLSIFISTALPEDKETDRVSMNLGRKPSNFGSQNQAKEMLMLMEKRPGNNGYEIFYQTEVDNVSLVCDMDNNLLIRTHRDFSGRISREVWKDYIVDRLKSASEGGTLNDTRDGKKFGLEGY